MHKGVICLTKATDKQDAISNVESFLESYGDSKVWDWYEIGGRWSGTLGDDDSTQLTNCVIVVEEWKQDLEAEADELWDKMIEARTQEKSGENNLSSMSGYYAVLYSEAKHDDFCFNSNVFDIDKHTNNPEEALKVPEQYFAVMVDMHN